jgi:hypothetical protein
VEPLRSSEGLHSSLGLTTRKSRKARAAAAQHGIVVVLFYRRDLERLSEQHGLRLDEAA